MATSVSFCPLIVFYPRVCFTSSAKPLLLNPSALSQGSSILFRGGDFSVRQVKLRDTPTLRFALATAKGSADSMVDHNDNLEALQDEDDLRNAEELCEAYMQAIHSVDEKRIFDVESNIHNMVVKKLELDEKLSSLPVEIDSSKEKCIRLQADFDNLRKRFNKEMLTARGGMQREVIENLLPVVDNLETSRKQIKPETEKEKKIDASYQGIYKQFVEVLRSWHVSAIATVGKPFDPSLHEAIAREESEEYKTDIIIQELQRGFLLKDRVLRTAKVKVSLGPGSKKMSAWTNERLTKTDGF
ncbi:hypothetical protein SAY86_024457 [Trapa natans]|uniref:GrpE protein homolog n=1 Tax=Trapa natans TaxID=22666 RepID=A0AAN7M6P0_TRANT|nr:hypothetical protein SAY86_024457 [Trapa natans]